MVNAGGSITPSYDSIFVHSLFPVHWLVLNSLAGSTEFVRAVCFTYVADAARLGWHTNSFPRLRFGRPSLTFCSLDFVSASQSRAALKIMSRLLDVEACPRKKWNIGYRLAAGRRPEVGYCQLGDRLGKFLKERRKVVVEKTKESWR